jgi:hypothetical protein
MKKGLNHTRIVNEQKIIRGRFPLHRQKNKKNKQYRTHRKQCARGGTGGRPCWYSQRPSWGSVISFKIGDLAGGGYVGARCAENETEEANPPRRL